MKKTTRTDLTGVPTACRPDRTRSRRRASGSFARPTTSGREQLLRPGVDRVRRPRGRGLPADRDPPVRHQGRAGVRRRRLAEAARGRVPCRRARRHRRRGQPGSSIATRRWATRTCGCSSSRGGCPPSTTCSRFPAPGTATWIERTLLPDERAGRSRAGRPGPLCRNGCHGLEAAAPRPGQSRDRPPKPSSSDSSAPYWTGLPPERTDDHEVPLRALGRRRRRPTRARRRPAADRPRSRRARHRRPDPARPGGRDRCGLHTVGRRATPHHGRGLRGPGQGLGGAQPDHHAARIRDRLLAGPAGAMAADTAAELIESTSPTPWSPTTSCSAP